MYPFATAVGPRRDPGPYFLFRDDELASPASASVGSAAHLWSLQPGYRAGRPASAKW
jgi:hypothetical protein